MLWSQAPLTLAVKEGFNLLFRNLDATATLLRTVELRGKTIQNVSTCTGYSMMGPVLTLTQTVTLALTLTLTSTLIPTPAPNPNPDPDPNPHP